MNESIRQLAASPKIRISGERLGEIAGAEEQARSEMLIPNLLIEVSSMSEFEGIINQDQIPAQNYSLFADILPNPIVKGNFPISQLLKFIELDLVISVEEDIELNIEEA